MNSNVIYSEQKISPFGGLNFLISTIRKLKLATVVDSCLGARVSQAKYSYSDVLFSWLYSNYCGSERLEDANHLKKFLNIIPGLNYPSPDCVGRVFRSMGSACTEFKHTSVRTRKEHSFYYHEGLNSLLAQISLKTGMLKKGVGYTVDYDNVIIETEKYDSSWTYDKTKGYQPGVTFVDGLPVYIEGRHGNANAVTGISDSVVRSIESLQQEGIKVSKFRSDAAAFRSELIHYFDERSIDYFIRLPAGQSTVNMFLNCRGWKDIMVGDQRKEVTSTEYTLKHSRVKTRMRVVVLKTDSSNGVLFRGIVTNNWDMSDEEVVHFYNARGGIERHFDDLKNNFNWSRVPFSFLNENTAFLTIAAIGFVLYRYFVKLASAKHDWVPSNVRLRRFIMLFITVGSEWIDNDTLKLYTPNRYQELLE